MQLMSVYEMLGKPEIRSRLSLEDIRKLFALTADFAPEFSFLVSSRNDSIRIRETIIWLAENRTLRKPLAEVNVGHSHFKDVPYDIWVYRAIESFVVAGYIEGYPGYLSGYYSRPERTFTRYEFAIVTARIYTKLEYGYYSKLNDAEILRLLALSSEFAPEMGMLGFDSRPPLLALLEGRLFVPSQMNDN